MILLLNAIVVIVILVAVLAVNLLTHVLPLALVVLQDVLLNVRSVVGWAVPPQADAGLRPADHLGWHRLVRLARLGLEGDGVRSAALEGIVDGVNADVVLGARPKVGEAALD